MENVETKQDLTYGEDCRGDYALFIERGHINGDELDEEAKAFTKKLGPTFFRVTEHGKQRSSHGWIIAGQIVQWG